MDVFLVSQPIAEGETERARELLRDMNGVDEDEAMRIIDREGVFTESGFLWETGEGDFILYYIEAEDGGRVKEVYDDELEDPEDEGIQAFKEVVAGPPTLLDTELLYHVVHPERPRSVE
jgi:hypothetical protein